MARRQPTAHEIREAALSEAQIAVHWREEEYFPPPEDFVAQANANDPAILARFSEEHFPECFVEYAEMLDWDKKWDTILDTSNPPFWKWFVGGRLNASVNCVDRHLASRGDKSALIWVPEPEDEETQHVTYGDLHGRVNEFAALLKDFGGVQAGDRVTFHLPMVPELPVSMLACARLGVIHSEVFGGFAGAACGHRVADSQSKILVTIDGYYRNGDLIDHKAKADEAIEAAREEGVEIEKVLVWRRHPGQYASKSPMVEGRDYFVDEVLQDYEGKTVEPVSMPAEAPLFLMYTSGTTGRPKGCQHSTGGYLAYVTGTSKYYQDIHPDDVYWCFADIGWITGHSYIVYGPLSLGTSSVMYEGVPTYPDAGRPWRIAEKLGVDIFHTAPTTIRMLRKVGPDEPAKYDYHFKTMTTVGEPIEPDVWRWYYDFVGKGRAAITDTWWMTETGGFLGSTLPGLQPMKPGSCGPAALGIQLVIYDENGEEIPRGSGKAGYICVRNPWPGRMLTVWGQDQRFIDTYYARFNKDKDSKDWRDWPFMCGDGAVEAEDGYFRILGRIDDVINVAGHRLGTKELESAAITVDEVAEAAAVPVIDEIRGKIVEMYVSVKPGVDPAGVDRKVSDAIVREIGAIARPKNVWVVADMPKTRSGKIMRRVIAAVSNFADVGDVSTLANPEIVEDIRHHVQSEKLAHGEVPRELSEKEKQEIAAFGGEPGDGNGGGGDDDRDREDGAPEPGSVDDRHIAIWVRERERQPDLPLRLRTRYVVRVRVGATRDGSLVSDDRARVPAADIPPDGLVTRWLFSSETVALAALDAQTETLPAGDDRTIWTASFELLIPREGNSRTVELEVTPQEPGTCRVDVAVRTRGELYRELSIELEVQSDGATQPPVGKTVRVAATVLRPAAQLGLRSPREWQKPPAVLELRPVGGGWMAVNADGPTGVIRDLELEWSPRLTQVNNAVEWTRGAAETFRVQFEDALNDIDPDDLRSRLDGVRDRLERFPPRYWADVPDLADDAHRKAWERIASSSELRNMAADGYALYDRVFPDGSDLRVALDGLEPGSRLQLNFAHAPFDAALVPWSLMYRRRPDPVRPIDPREFLGLRLRIGCNAWTSRDPVRRNLGAPDRSWRAHALYWGPGDGAAIEAAWQRQTWTAESNHLYAPEPADASGQAAKRSLLALLERPGCSPLSVLYLYCRSAGSAGNPELRFGRENGPDDVVTRRELPTSPLEDRPFVFANACTTLASDPLHTNELTVAFGERGCRAFLGTETKVPVVLASRFASIFFYFFGRHVDGGLIAAGEALAQTRLFLWSDYRNLGGLFYTYLNEYELYLGEDDEVKALAR